MSPPVFAYKPRGGTPQLKLKICPDIIIIKIYTCDDDNNLRRSDEHSYWSASATDKHLIDTATD